MLAALDAAAAREDRGLQLLMTQQEALHLTEQAQNHGLQGMSIWVCNPCAAHLCGVVAHLAGQQLVKRGCGAPASPYTHECSTWGR